MAGRTSLQASIVLVGFCGLVAQVLIVREMVVTFHGSELSIGVMLATWLLWTGLGSLGLGGLLRWCRRPTRWLAVVLLLLAAALVATVAGAQMLRTLLLGAGVARVGEVLPFRVMVSSCALLLGPLCLLNGEAYRLGRGTGGRRELWESIEGSIHAAKSLLTDQAWRSALANEPQRAGDILDQWTEAQSAMILKVLQALQGG